MLFELWIIGFCISFGFFSYDDSRLRKDHKIKIKALWGIFWLSFLSWIMVGVIVCMIVEDFENLTRD